MFNGALISLLDWSSAKKLQLSLAVTCYRDQLFSNLNAAAWRKIGRKDYFARALGISAILQTADAQVVLMKRSALVGEYPGLYDVLGGHIDFPGRAENISAEFIFNAIKGEICEETGLVNDEVQIHACLGLLENCEIEKPELLFFASTNLPASVIHTRSATARENFEFENLFFIAAEPRKFTDYWQRNRQQFTPSADGCLEIFIRLNNR